MKIAIKDTEEVANFMTVSVEVEMFEADANNYNKKWEEYIDAYLALVENEDKETFNTADYIIELVTQAAKKTIKKIHAFMQPL